MKKIILILPILIYIGASLWANFDLFPEDFMQYWWFDDIGHIFVFGIVGTSLTLAAQHFFERWWTGIIATYVLAVLDEFSQLFILARTFSWHDLYMSCVGITVVLVVAGVYFHNQKSTPAVTNSNDT